jgi:NAD(P)-dependent dehydrogenase (short-subunit alcohol dehydrogenase family)
MSKSKNVFITGGNRGIGLGLVKEIIKRFQPENLFATYRNADGAQDLRDLAAKNPCLHLIQLDVRDEAKIQEAVNFVAEKTEGAGLNLLLNNSGVLGSRGGLQDQSKQDMMDTYEINTVAPVLIAKAFLPLLEKASKSSGGPPGIGRAAIVNITSQMGSIADNGSGGYYGYRNSKAALNISTVSMSKDLASSKIIAVVIHPGWVKTDMGGQSAPTTTEQSVAGIVDILEGLNESKSGKFLNWKGNELPW